MTEHRADRGSTDPRDPGLPGEPQAPPGETPSEYERAFSVVAFAMNRFIVDHMLRASRLFDHDTETMILFGVLSHLNVAHLLPPGTRPSDSLDASGQPALDPQPMLRPVRLRDLVVVTGRPRESIRRRLERLRATGRVLRVDGGWVLNIATIDEPLRSITLDGARRFMETAAVLRSALAALAFSTAALAHAQDGSAPKGVNPKDNLSKLELIYKGDALDGSQRIDSFTVKYDRALTPLLGANVELPIVRYSGPFLTESGVGDMNFRVRYNLQRGAVTFIPGLEIVAPTASQDVLGLGKWQLNPVLGAVMPLSQTAFVFAGYKHLYSIGGDDARPDINASQPRLLVATLSAQGWWLLADAKYTHDWGTKLDAFDIELEAGRMLSPNTGISARIGTSALDSARGSTIGLNLRFIF